MSQACGSTSFILAGAAAWRWSRPAVAMAAREERVFLVIVFFGPDRPLDGVGVCALIRRTFSLVHVHAGKLSLQPEVLRAGQEATNGLKHSEKRSPFGASVRAGRNLRVNTEQAPKASSWEPTRYSNGEGRRPGGRSEREKHPRIPPR